MKKLDLKGLISSAVELVNTSNHPNIVSFSLSYKRTVSVKNTYIHMLKVNGLL